MKEQIIEILKSSTKTLLETAERYYRIGDREKAIRFYEEAMKNMKAIIRYEREGK